MLTAQQVQDAIEQGNISINGYDEESDAYEFYGDWWGNNKAKKITVDGTEYTAEVVEEFGGMDMGSEAWVVFKIDNQLFKKYGSYYSHDGYYWDGSLDEVRPVQKVITVFE